VNFFFDRNFPLPLAKMIAIYAAHYGEHGVEHHDHSVHGFQPDTPDVEWIRVLADQDPRPVVISGDLGILKRAAELEALREAELSFFVLAGRFLQRSPHEATVQFLRVWPRMVEEAAKARRPQIWEVPVSSLQLKLLGETGSFARRRRR
jgi:hypothetical protein